MAFIVSSHSLIISKKYLTVKSSFLYPSYVNLQDSCSSSTFKVGIPAKWRPKSFSFNIYNASPGIMSCKPFLNDKIYFSILSLIFIRESALTYSFLFSSTTSIYEPFFTSSTVTNSPKIYKVSLKVVKDSV